MTPIYIVGDGMHAKYLMAYLGGRVLHQLTFANFPLEACDPVKFKNSLSHLVRFDARALEGAVIINTVRATHRDNATPERMARLNGLLPHVIADVAKYYNMQFIHLSTNCVFSGHRGKYLETDEPDAIDPYGRSMAMGEPEYGTVIRASVIGEGDPTNLLEWVKGQSGQVVNGWTTVEWNGITAVELCQEVEACIETRCQGTFHRFGQTMTKSELIEYIAQMWDVDIKLRPVRIANEKKTLGSIYAEDFYAPMDGRLEELRLFNISHHVAS